MFYTKSGKYKSWDELLKMSLVPVACQETQLNADGCTQCESVEWLLDLTNKTPIWSRLLDINTSGFKRRLPLSMTENYDIEVEGRLWSLWGTTKQLKTLPNCSKSYMAITVMALCAARVINLNGWHSNLMDIIKANGRLYFKESIKKVKCSCKDFHLNNLLTECKLEGIQFSLHLKAVRKGFLYGSPLECQTNLALALIHFFDNYQYGILECCNRILGFGFTDGPQGGYFMYDAQSFSDPLFAPGLSAPYLLRTNHLQVLLYCLVVALNVCRRQAWFCLYHVEILVQNPYEYKIIHTPSEKSVVATSPRIIASELWKTQKSDSITDGFSQEPHIEFQSENNENETQHEVPFRKKYRRKIYNIREEEVQQSPIKPLIDADRKSDEDFRLKKDFVRMVCSDTVLPLTTADLPRKCVKEFSCNLVDALLMGPETCLMFNKL